MRTDVTLASMSTARHRPDWLARRLPLGLTVSTAILSGIILLAAFLRFYNLDAIGNGNLYYTAAVESMLQSWKNFFFVAAEPGGSVTVDKPPLGLWLQAASAAVFGVNGFAVALPQILAGILSVPVLYLLIKRYFGEAAGLIAAFTLAVTPVSIAVERNNTMDATLIFTLLLAAWAFVKATDTGKLRWLLAGAALVGVGFNIKMMQAFLPLPAFYALYFLGSQERWGRKIVNLALATIVLLIVSFSWAAAVDLTPADQRPYVGSSENNTVTELIFGHNGLNRLFGGRGRRTAVNGGGPSQDQQPIGPRSTAPPQGRLPSPSPPDADGPQAGQNNPGGSGEIGQPGVFRLFTEPLSNEIGWLLPFGLLSIGLVAVSSSLRLPLTDIHKSVILWGGWLLTSVVFFSVAEFYHAYYLAMLAPPLAALVGIGIIALWQMHRRRPIITWNLLALAGLGTVLYQMYVAHQYVDSALWLPLSLLLIIGGVILLTINIIRRTRVASVMGMVAIVAAMLITPAVWSVFTTLEEIPHIGLPGAYAGENSSRADPTNRQDVDQALLNYLQANTQDVEYLVAVRSAQEGSGLVIETGRPVLYMGGFNGGDPVVSAADLDQMVADGELRYVLWSENGRRVGGSGDIGTWLQNRCTPVSLTAAASNLPPADGSARPGMPNLYECSW